MRHRGLSEITWRWDFVPVGKHQNGPGGGTEAVNLLGGHSPDQIRLCGYFWEARNLRPPTLIVPCTPQKRGDQLNLAPKGGRAPRRAQVEGATVSEPPGLGDANGGRTSIYGEAVAWFA